MYTIRPARKEDITEIHKLINKTIRISYPQIYKPRVVQYFIDHHNLSEIEKRMNDGFFLVLLDFNVIRATGFIDKSELGGVYVDPECQRKGMGSAVVNSLLEYASKHGIKRLFLHSTPTAKHMYDTFGFKVLCKRIENICNEPLEYYRMEYLMQ